MTTQIDPAALSCDERKRRGIRRDGKPRATSLKGYARIRREAKREEAEQRRALSTMQKCGHWHTGSGAMYCRDRAAS